jgi:cytochrome b involved in lipid metabolism
MRNTRIFFIVMFMAAALLLFSGCAMNNKAEPVDTAPPPAAEAPADEVPADAEDADTVVSYTLEEIAMHDAPEDCWFAIHGKVYDVTGFGENHGGGDSVYEGCGMDATELFETRPMGSGTPHSEKAHSFLLNFEIGELATE